MEFVPFPKIARLNRDCTVTEKIDGSNAQVTIVPAGPKIGTTEFNQAVAAIDGFYIFAGSRSRWLQPTKQKDNFGFASWVKDNAQELLKLGEGSHFGEWWGNGIQRGYGLPKHEKRFSLFNTARWSDPAVRPTCCQVVPVLYQGPFLTTEIRVARMSLEQHGSYAAPGFMDPEGMIIFHHAQNSMFKVTLKNDEAPKSLVKEAA